MADEITINLSVDVVSGNTRASFRPLAITPDLAIATFKDGVQNINTSAGELLSVPTDVSAGGYCWFRNLSTSTSVTYDPTISISHGAATNAAFMQLRPSEYALIRCVTTTMYAISSTATANLQFGMMSA